MKDKKMLFGIGIVFLFLASVGFSYAYFTASIANKDVKNQVVTTGTLELTYADGAEIKMLNIKPGQTITKKVTVKNTGTLDTAYNFVWQELNNTITNDEMVISATCKRLNGDAEEESCEGVDETSVKENIIKKNVSIEPGITHEYNVTITFKETNAAQNYNQGKTFSGVLGINEYKKTTPQAVYCTYDGELTKGAEYVNGVYTYKYKQHKAYQEINGQNYAYWGDMDLDGWGVAVEENNGVTEITEAPCTYINDVPVVSMSGMFVDASNVTKITKVDVSKYNTSNVVNMDSMFSYLLYAEELTGLENLDTSNVTSMRAMFHMNYAPSLDVSNFDTSKVTSMKRMFSDTKITNINLSNFDTSNVVDMNSMFYMIHVPVLDLSNFDTSKVTNMHQMFYDAESTSIDISSFDTSSITDASYMFFMSDKLKTIYASNKFAVQDNDNVYSQSMFEGTTNLVGGAGTVYDSTKVDKTYARIDGGTSSPGYFTSKN